MQSNNSIIIFTDMAEHGDDASALMMLLRHSANSIKAVVAVSGMAEEALINPRHHDIQVSQCQ